MRQLLLTGLLFAALSVACANQNPTNPGTLTILQTTTTTSVVPIIPARHYVAFQPGPNVPIDMTLFFQLTGGASASVSSVFSGLTFWNTPAANKAAAAPTYTVTGVYGMSNGLNGQVNGQLGGSPTPLDNGTFNGTLTLNVPGCTAERQFSGSTTPQVLQWTGGDTLRNCPGDPLAFSSLTLLATSAPTTIPSTTTTSILCNYSLSSTSTTIESTGGSGSVTLSVDAGCGWTVKPSVDWIVVQGALSGSGSARISFLVGANAGAQRVGSLLIGNVSFVVTQSGAL